MDSKVKLVKKNPHDDANFISRALLLWSFKLFHTGFKKDLTQDDLYMPSANDLSNKLGDSLEEAWNDELERAKQNDCKPSLNRAIIKVFWFRYMMWGAIGGILYIILMPMIPFTLALFIGYFSGEKNNDTYMWAHIHNFILNALSIFTSITSSHVMLGQGIMGMQVRIACCSLVYRKLLRLDRMAINKTAPGQVVNLMSNDVQRFDLVSITLHFIWVMPILVAIVSFLVWRQIHVATVAVLIVIAVQSVLIQGYLSKLQGTLRGKIAKRTDDRVRVMNELVNGVQVIKMYAWETPFEKLVAKLRKLEVNLIFKTMLIKGFSTALTVFTERFILLVGVVTFVAIGGQIRAEITFSLVQYFNLLQLACNIFFPMALAFLMEAKVSVKRLEDFLTLDDAIAEGTDRQVQQINGNITKQPKASALIVKGGYASWTSEPIVDTLSNINLNISPGQFFGIAGPVGSGKSTLLQVIIGELPLKKGSLSLGNARISYASQEPWLFVASVRQNILFGLPYDKIRYKKVVAACALVRDFEQLPHGDQTLVGERGISLSGGQRARIALARAVYRQADIYILDDPLSAVDTHVGKHLVSECINGYLRHHTRILVTHQLHHLKTADNIIVMRDGLIETEGIFDDVSKNPLFADLIEEEEEELEQDLDLNVIKTQRQRSMSTQSHSSIGSRQSVSQLDAIIPNNDIEQQEDTELVAKGNMPISVYKKFFSAGAGCGFMLLVIVSVLVAQAVTSGSDLWLTHWMNENEKYLDTHPSNVTILPSNFTSTANILTNENKNVLDNVITKIDNMTINGTEVPNSDGRFDHWFYIWIWALLIVACIIFTTERSLLFFWMCTRASIGLHNKMFTNILNATMRFFDTNPSGRILNRFSKDMGIVDEILPKMMLDSLQIFLIMLGILFMVCLVNPYMIITAVVCSVIMYLLTIVYLKTAQAIKRVEGVTRSPVFSHVTSSMSGLSTIRTCGAQNMLMEQFDSKQDIHTAAWYLTLITNTAFSVWLSLTNSSFVAIVAYSFLFIDNGSTEAGNVGLAISQALILVNMVQHGIKQTTEVISQMTCVERIMQYTKLPQEHPLESLPAQKPPVTWPANARILFKDLYLRYEEGGEPVLKNLNIVIESGWKVGVVGRTGAGKSSLISALFRLAVLDGDIVIDEVNTAEIGLRDLRRKLSIIPQEPVLFTATLRYNLDPFDKHTDVDIWKTLEMVELKSNITSLSMEVTAGGTNFSAGQRQLLCLARAILSHNKILVLDEATANVDPQTDGLIQKTIRSHFKDCTVITVAHRLHTVADSDRVLVMDGGEVKQYNHPHLLLHEKDGIFFSMVEQLTPAAQNSLKEVARQAYEKQVKYVEE